MDDSVNNLSVMEDKEPADLSGMELQRDIEVLDEHVFEGRLTPEGKAYACRLYVEAGYTQPQLAKVFNVSLNHIRGCAATGEWTCLRRDFERKVDEAMFSAQMRILHRISEEAVTHAGFMLGEFKKIREKIIEEDVPLPSKIAMLTSFHDLVKSTVGVVGVSSNLDLEGVAYLEG